MPIYKEPLEVQCFWCKQKILVKYIVPHKGYSKKNNWEYWTEKEENKDKYVCDKCLLGLYKNRKHEFHKLITNERLKKNIRKYVYDGKL